MRWRAIRRNWRTCLVLNMTSLEKSVNRKTRGAYRILYATPRQIIVSLKPGDVLAFREAGRRQEYSIPIDTVFRIAVRNWATAEAERKKLERKNKRKAGL